MATPLVVQTKTATTNSSATSLGVTFTNNNLDGNMIVAIVDANGTDTMTAPTDTQGNTYNVLYNDSTQSSPVGSAWYAFNIKSGANTVTAHLGGANNEVTLIVREYSGVTKTDPLDTFKKSTGNSTAISSGATTQTKNSYRLVVGLGHEGFGSGQTWAVGAGFINLTSVSTNSGEGCAIEDKIVGVLAAETATFTLGTGTAWIGGVATFFPSGGSFQPNKLRPAIFKPGLAR